MNIPGSEPSGIERNIEQVDSIFFPLNHNQIARARGLGISDERLRAIQARNLNSRLFLGTLRRHKRALAYLKYITQKVSPHGPIRKEDSVKEWSPETIQDDVTKLIKELFDEKYTKESIQYIAAYAAEDEREREWYLHMIGLLTLWNELGIEHDSYARLPREAELLNKKDEPREKKIYDEARNIWGNFTGRITGNKVKGYTLSYEFYAYDNDGKGLFLFQVKNEKLHPGDAKVFSQLGRSPGSNGDKYSDFDIELLEEYYIIAGDAPLIYQPPTRLIAQFLEKHRSFFAGNRSLYTWDIGRQIVERLSEPIREVPSKIRGNRPQKPRTSYTTGTPVTSNEAKIPVAEKGEKPENLTEIRYASPEIYGGFQNILAGGNAFNETTERTAKNLPIDSVLWIGIEGNPTLWKRYLRGTNVEIEAPTTKTWYLFSFTGANFEGSLPPEEKKYPRTRIEVSPRSNFPKGGGQSSERTTLTAKVVDQVLTPLVIPGDTTPPQKEGIDDRTDEVGLEILEILENPTQGMIVSSVSPILPMIEGVFLTHPAIHFYIDTQENRVRFGPRERREVHIDRLEKDLTGTFPTLIEVARTLREKLYIERFAKIQKKLSYLLGTLTAEIDSGEDGEALEISDILEASRIHERYGGDIFMARIHQGKFEAIRSMFEKEGVEISLVDDSETRGKNYSLSAVFDDGIGGKVAYKISRTQSPPYFAFSAKESGFRGKVDTNFRGISLDIYLLLSLLGKEIFAHQPGAASASPRGYSEERIGKILDGTYTQEKRIPRTFSDSEKTLIEQAAQRVKNGNLKISQGQMSDVKSGLLVPHIVTARGIVEFHRLEDSDEIVLVDTKFTCIDDEKARKMEEKWGKKKRKHPYSATYAIIKSHERSRKYITRRMVATITGETYRGLSGFSNRMEQFFREFWRNIPENVRQEFLLHVAGKGGHPGKGLSVKLPDGRGLFDAFIEEADERKIPLLYSKPKTLTKGTVVEYIKSEDYTLWTKTLTREKPDMGEVRGK